MGPKQVQVGQVKSRMPGVKPDFPATDFEIRQASWLGEIDRIKVDQDRKWGTDRLCTLVDPGFREKFWQQQQRVWSACQARDSEKLEKSAAGMVRAYQALEAWAVQHAVPVRPAVGAVEHVGKDGKLMVVVATKQDAVWYRENRPDVTGQHVWSMEEIELLIEAEINQAVVEAKIRYAKYDPDISAPSKGPKMFDSKTAEKFKHGSNQSI